MTRPGLTRQQSLVYQFIAAFIEKEGFGPSYRTVANGAGLGLSTVHAAVRTLLKRQYLVADTDPLGKIAKGSLALAAAPAKAAVTVFVAPNGEFVRTESSGDVSVTVRTHFPPLENSNERSRA